MIEKNKEASEHQSDIKLALLHILDSMTGALDREKNTEEKSEEEPDKKVGLEKEYQDLIEEIQKTEKEKQEVDQSDGKDNQNKPEEETKAIENVSKSKIRDYFNKIDLVEKLEKFTSEEKDESVCDEAKSLLKNVKRLLK